MIGSCLHFRKVSLAALWEDLGVSSSEMMEAWVWMG